MSFLVGPIELVTHNFDGGMDGIQSFLGVQEGKPCSSQEEVQGGSAVFVLHGILQLTNGEGVPESVEVDQVIFLVGVDGVIFLVG